MDDASNAPACYRGQVHLILTDPPYNTGEDFRYNDKWDTDPNDPDLGALVPIGFAREAAPAEDPRSAAGTRPITTN